MHKSLPCLSFIVLNLLLIFEDRLPFEDPERGLDPFDPFPRESGRPLESERLPLPRGFGDRLSFRSRDRCRGAGTEGGPRGCADGERLLLFHDSTTFFGGVSWENRQRLPYEHLFS